MAKVANKAVIAQTPDNIGSQQVNFVRSSFDDLITDKGYDCYIERALKCACRMQSTGQALPDCQNCGGTGWFFIDKVLSKVASTSMSHRTQYSNWTESNMGTVNITTRPQDRLGYMDRITLLELESMHSQSLTLKTNDANDAYFTFLTYYPILVFEMYKFEGSNVALKYMEQGVDFTISNQKVTLDPTLYPVMPNTNPPQISIRYVHNPTYHILDINRELIKQREGGLQPCSTTAGGNKTNLPINCVGRRAQYIFEMPDYNGNSLFDNTNYDRPPINYDI